jgi:hypothetical protein
MALYDKEHRAKHYDDFLDKLKDEETGSIDDAIDKIKNFEDKGNRHHYMFEKFKPASTKLYDTFKTKLHGHFGDGFDASVHGEENEKKVKNALFEALKDYMSVVRPGAVDALEELGIDEEDGLDHLMGLYDKMIGVNPQDRTSQGDPNGPKSIRLLLNPTRSKDGTLGDLLEMSADREQDIGHSWKQIHNKYAMHHLNKFDSHQFLKHAYAKVKDHGLYELSDKSKFLNQGKMSLYNLVKSINYQDFKNVDIDQYGLDKKTEEQQHGH